MWPFQLVSLYSDAKFTDVYDVKTKKSFFPLFWCCYKLQVKIHLGSCAATCWLWFSTEISRQSVKFCWWQFWLQSLKHKVLLFGKGAPPRKLQCTLIHTMLFPPTDQIIASIIFWYIHSHNCKGLSCFGDTLLHIDLDYTSPTHG